MITELVMRGVYLPTSIKNLISSLHSLETLQFWDLKQDELEWTISNVMTLRTFKIRCKNSELLSNYQQLKISDPTINQNIEFM